ncbi:hypothetical protein AB0B79_06190 [Streptomyces sp. NPDC039022]|uniref:hypothetical protein n=1 Tax=Streptomyces sp. NPDC039022 TaxID=3157091 RepID=UPI00340BFEA5
MWSDRLRHVRDDPAQRLPPSAERLTAFFAYARARLATVSDYPAAARDYALWRALYHSAPRLSEALRLELCAVHPELGPSGKLHVRFGKAVNASRPRPRWVPMLDGLDRILAWYQSDMRGRVGVGWGSRVRGVRSRQDWACPGRCWWRGCWSSMLLGR